MEQRFEVAKLLNEGMIYNDILERTGASSATISRVNRSLLGGAGGYESILEKMKLSSHLLILVADQNLKEASVNGKRKINIKS